MKNGTCIKIDNSFISIYNVTSTSNFVRIIYNLDSNYNSLLNKYNYGINDFYKFQKTGLIDIK